MPYFIIQIILLKPVLTDEFCPLDVLFWNSIICSSKHNNPNDSGQQRTLVSSTCVTTVSPHLEDFGPTSPSQWSVTLQTCGSASCCSEETWL